MKKILFIILILFMLTTTVFAADRYWVGGTSNWDDTNTLVWSATSGGAGGASIPTNSDNVHFNAASGSGTTTVTKSSYSNDLNFFGYTGTITSSGLEFLYVYGNVELGAGMTYDNASNLYVTLSGSSNATFKSAGKTFGFFDLDKSGGSITLQDNFKTTKAMNFQSGTFNTNNKDLNTINTSGGGANLGINLGSSVWTITSSGWAVTSAGLGLNAGTSTIVMTATGNFVGGTLTYYDLNYTGSATGLTIQNSSTFHAINLLTRPMTFTIIFGTTVTLLTPPTWKGTAGSLITLYSGAGGYTAHLSLASGIVGLDYMSIKDIHVIGGAAWYAGSHSIDVSGNDGWLWTDPQVYTAMSGCGAGWNGTNQTITLTCTPAPGATCTATQYKLDGNTSWTNYTVPFVLSTDGNHRVDYNSTDNFPSTETTKTSYCAIDKTAPSVGTTTLSGFNIYTTYIKGTGSISATISDTNSGVNTTQCQYTPDNGTNWYAADGNATHCYKTGLGIIGSGTYRFNLRGKDNAGNQGTGTATSSYTADTTAPTTSFVYLQRPLYSIADFNLSCADAGAGCAITLYKIDDGNWTTYTSTVTITGSGTYTIYYNSNDNIGNQETQKSGAVYISPDVVAPTLSYTMNKVYGFGADLNFPITLTCSGDRLDQLYFGVNVDSVNVLHALDNNGATQSGSFIPSSGSPTITFVCTNQSGLTTTVTVANAFQVFQFQLVNENTGALLTTYDIDNNFLIARIYSIDENYKYDFKANHTADVNAVLPSKQLVFNFGYADTQSTQINRVINGSIEITTPMRICAPFFQQFYEQQFVSYTARSITLYNYPANCYVLQGQLNYLSSSNYGLTTYTTNMPMYLYTWVNGVKTVFSLIDGGLAQAYNLDVIALTRTTITYTSNLDGLGVAPLINPLTNKNDLNTLSIQYISGDTNNTSVNIQILNGTTVLYNQTFVDANAVNAFNLNWFYGGIPGITSATYLKIIVTAENPGGQKVTSRTVNVDGEPPKIDIVVGNKTFYGNFPIMLSIVALIISSLFFFFAMSIASTGHTFGMFGILMVLACIAIAAIAVQIWYIDLIIGFYILVLLIIIFSGKPRTGYTLS